MEMSVISVVSVQLMVVVGIAAALLLYLMRFRRTNCVEVGHKAVLVTDCNGAAGRLAAYRLHSLGFRVFAACADKDSASASELRVVSASCTRLHVLHMDPGKVETIAAAVEEVEKNLSTDENGLWAVVNTSALCVSGLFEWQTWEQCEQQIAINLIGTLRLAKALVPLLRVRRGRMVTVTLLDGESSYPGFSVYAATKAALEAFSQTLQMELETFGVKTVTIAPAGDFCERAAILTAQEHVDAMWKNMTLENKRAYKNTFQAFCHRVKAPVGSPDEIIPDPALEALLSDVELAVLSKQPRAHYTSAPLKTKLWMHSMSLLPSEWKRQRLMKQFHRSFLNEQVV